MVLLYLYVRCVYVTAYSIQRSFSENMKLQIL